MLNEEQVKKLPHPLVKRLESINALYMTKIGQRIKEIGEMSPTDVHRLTAMIDYGADIQEITIALTNITAKNAEDIDEIFDIIAKDNYDFAKTYYDNAGKSYITYESNKQLQKYVNAMAKTTAKEYAQLSQHTAFMIFGSEKNRKKKIPTSLSDTYTKVIDMAVEKIALGVSDYQSEMRGTLKALSDSGIRTRYTPLKGRAGKTVDYATGYSRRLDTAARQNILWGVKQLNQGIQDQTGEEFGADGYEIDYHANSRPSHSDMGGKQYAIGKGRSIKGKYYPSFDRVKHLLDDYGCLHFKYSIILGVSEPNHTDKELKALKANEKETVTFEGKEYTPYEATQIQRKLETATRHAKDRQIIANAAGDDTLRREEQAKINHLTSKYAKFSKEAGLPTKKERMSISGYHKVKEAKELKSVASTANKLYNLDSESKNINAYLRDKPIVALLESQSIKFKKYISEKEIVVTVPSRQIRGTTKHYLDNLSSKDDRRNLGLEKCERIVNNSKLQLYNNSRNTIKYLADDGYVVLNLDGMVVTAVPQKWRKKYDKYLEDE